MPRTRALIASLAAPVLLAAGAAGLWLWDGSGATTASVPAGAAEPSGRSAAPAPASTAGSRPVTPAMSVDAALKQLDLIRPSRQMVAEEFAIPMSNGSTFRLSDHRGSVVFINFWATWCPPCLEEMPAMERLYARQKNRRFVMLAVSVDADPKRAAAFASERRFTFLIGLDPKMQLANSYGVRALPSSFIVDPHGNVAALALGPRVWDNEASHALVNGIPR